LVGIVGPRLPREKVERLARPVFLVVKLRAVLQLKAPLLDGRLDAEFVEQQHRGRHQRLADVESRESLALEQRHAQTAVREDLRSAAAATAASGYADVQRVFHDPFPILFASIAVGAASASRRPWAYSAFTSALRVGSPTPLSATSPSSGSTNGSPSAAVVAA